MGVFNIKNVLLINNEINAKEIRLIDADGTMVGIMPTSEALELAFQKGSGFSGNLSERRSACMQNSRL